MVGILTQGGEAVSNNVGSELLAQRDPFRVFFPAGLVYGLWGVGAWLAFSLDLLKGYPGVLHTSLLLGGFELCFIVGFLMTAVPRFTGTGFASKGELLSGATLLVIPGILAALDLGAFIYLSSLATMLFLVVFGYRRFRHRQMNPPDSFAFVGAALLMGLLSHLVYLLGKGDFVAGLDAVVLSRSLLHHGFMLGLVMGIGGRLIPGLLGWSEIVAAQRSRYEQPLPFWHVVSPFILVTLALFVLSFPLEWLWPFAGRIIRAAVVLAMGYSRWRLHRRPVNRSMFAWAVWVACWCIVLGVFCYAFLPGLALESEHIVFIGGYSLLTLLVASRVTLSHGEAGSLLFEKLRWPYASIAGIMVVSVLTRFFAAAIPRSYSHHLGYAAAIWLVGACLWGGIFLPKIFKTWQNQSKSS